MTFNRSLVYSGYSTNKTDRHNIIEILLKEALKTITPNNYYERFIFLLIDTEFIRRVWWYQSDNQNPYIEEEQRQKISAKEQTTIYKTYT